MWGQANSGNLIGLPNGTSIGSKEVLQKLLKPVVLPHFTTAGAYIHSIFLMDFSTAGRNQKLACVLITLQATVQLFTLP